MRSSCASSVPPTVRAPAPLPSTSVATREPTPPPPTTRGGRSSRSSTRHPHKSQTTHELQPRELAAAGELEIRSDPEASPFGSPPPTLRRDGTDPRLLLRGDERSQHRLELGLGLRPLGIGVGSLDDPRSGPQHGAAAVELGAAQRDRPLAV